MLTKSYDHEYWWAKLTHGQPIVFKVGSKAYTKNAADQLALYLTKVNKVSSAQAYKTVFNDLKVQAAAEASGAQPNASEIAIARNQLSLNPQITKNYTYPTLGIYVQAVPLAIERLSQGEYEGYSFVFWFGQHVLDTGSPLVTDIGNKTLIAADQAYAQQQAQKYHDLLSNHQIEPALALSQIKSDPKISYLYIPGSNPSSDFGTPGNPNWQGRVSLQPIIDFINGQHNVGLSGVQTGTSEVPNTAPKNYPKTFFYFTLLTNAQASSDNVGAKYQQDLKSLKSKYYGV